jgi:hypothetical protein
MKQEALEQLLDLTHGSIKRIASGGVDRTARTVVQEPDPWCKRFAISLCRPFLDDDSLGEQTVIGRDFRRHLVSLQAALRGALNQELASSGT